MDQLLRVCFAALFLGRVFWVILSLFLSLEVYLSSIRFPMMDNR